MTKNALIFGIVITLAAAAFGQDGAVADMVTADAQAASPIETIDPASGEHTVELSLPILRIATQPAGAVVTVGGEEYGVSPVEIIGLAPGEHTVELSLPGHFRRRATIQLAPEGADLTFELSRPATYSVTSEPEGATVTINGEVAGTTPLRMERLRPGEYKVSLSADGYAQKDEVVHISSGESAAGLFVLAPITTAPEATAETTPQPESQTQIAETTEQPQSAAETSGKGKRSWRNEAILIAFCLFVAVLVGVEATSY